ncbi:MAG: bacterial Ig-like domain-containing protein [Clostridiales bacterium]|nr:bacterial Ig-like domain-containing protein [Clostridiales bacterium]
MNKKIRSILIVLLAVVTVVFTALGIAACNSVKLKGLKIENERTEFKVGDEFEVGEDFTVYALYSDGSEKDVTQEVEFRYEAGFDMNVAGDYQITVIWGGKREIYTIYVNAFDNVLKKIELNTQNVKKEYDLGDSLDLTGLEITCTYENAQGNPVVSKTTSLKNFTVTIVSDSGTAVTDVLDELGNFTVTISQGNIKDSFKVSATRVNISTVQGAIAAGKAFSGNVVSGRHIIKNAQPAAASPTEKVSLDYTYEFGVNYTYIKESADSQNEYHFSIDEKGTFCVQFSYGEMVPNPEVNAEMMNGTPYHLWYHRVRPYGVENVLNTLYAAAKECTNKDLKETADEASKTYTFSFSGLVFTSNANDYYETQVTFTLGDDYSIKHAEYVQKYWEGTVDSHTFTTDSNGYTTPIGNYNELDRETVDQVSGERTKTNPYTRDMFIIQSYDLTHDGRSLGDEGVIDYTMGQNPNNTLTIHIDNMFPETANFTQDPMYFNYPGNFGGDVDSGTMLYTDGYFIFRTGKLIVVQLLNGGVWTLILKTSHTYKTVTFNVTGIAPTSMTAQLYNTTTNRFYEANQKATGIGGSVYFRGAVNQYANEAQTAQITSGNSDYATVEETTVNGLKCFKFSATTSGTYTVTVTSAADSSVKCTFTFTVSEMPDYDSILSGKYTVTDYDGNIYIFEFTPSGTGEAANGTLVVTQTPTTEDGEPILEQAQMQTLTYSISLDDLSIVLTSVSGTNLGISLGIDEQNRLVLEDKYSITYVLTRAN